MLSKLSQILSLSLVLFLVACSSSRSVKVDDGTFGVGDYVVQKGDTLATIAWRSGTTTQQLIAWNNLADPDRILIGQRLITKGETLPEVNTNTTATTSKTPNYAIKADWVWPVRGRVIRRFNAKRIGGNHIRIAGKKGQTVNAVDSGKVEYQGAGLNGYGNVVLIRQDNGFISLYGFLGQTFVKEGDYVKRRQKIGKVGIANDKKYALLFEVRRHGKPVNPLHYIGYKYHF